MKVHIRFLRQGLVKAETPENFEKMGAREKMDWAWDELCKMSDKDIINAMADFDDRPEINGYFDEAPFPAAIEIADMESDRFTEIILQTKDWEVFSAGGGDLFDKDGNKIDQETVF